MRGVITLCNGINQQQVIIPFIHTHTMADDYPLH